MIIKELQILSEAFWGAVKVDGVFFSAISSTAKSLSEFNFYNLSKEDLEEVNIYVNHINQFFNKVKPSGQGVRLQRKEVARNEGTIKRMNEIMQLLLKMSSSELDSEVKKMTPKKLKKVITGNNKVFIGHGRSKLWARVQLYLKDELNLDTFTFESESHTSESIIQILNEFLSSSSFAILILTAEDEIADGNLRARQNVIHEAGLFQGCLGFDKVVLLKQDKTEELSNLAGLQYIPFIGDNIEQTFYELNRKLKKSGLII